MLAGENPPDEGEFDLTKTYIFIALQLFGLIGCSIMLITALLSPLVHRHPTWYNFVIAWIISCVSYSLLYFGGHIETARPTFNLCLAQAALIYAAPLLAASASMGLVVQIWISIRAMLAGGRMKNEKLWSMINMILPYVLHIVIVIEVLIFVAHDPGSVRKTGSGMYCNTSIRIPGRITTGLVSLVLFFTIVIEVLIARALRKNWIVFKRQDDSLTMVIRVGIFSLFGVFAVVLSLVFFFTIDHGSDLNIVVSTLPAAAVLVFSTQKDMLQSWMFWKWRSLKDDSRKNMGLPAFQQDDRIRPLIT